MPDDVSSSEQTTATVASEEALPRKFSISEVMKKAGLPENIRKQLEVKNQTSPPKKTAEEEEPELPLKPEEETTPPIKESEETSEEEETPPAAKKKDETETEEELEEEEEPKGRLTLEKSIRRNERLLRRIDKLTARNHQGEGEREALNEQLRELQAALDSSSQVVVAPNPNDPLSLVQNQAQLAQVYQRAKIILDDARRNPDGYVLNEGTDKEVVITRNEMVDRLRNAEDLLNEHIPRKAKQLEALDFYDSEARKIYPDLFDRKTKDYQDSRSVWQSMPSIAVAPERAFYTGDYLLGVKVRTSGKMPQILALLNEKTPAKVNGVTETKMGGDLDARITQKRPPIAEDTIGKPLKQTAPSLNKKVEETKQQVVKSGGDTKALAAHIKAVWAARKGKGSPRELVKV